MARQKRGGFRTPEIRGTLGTLLRSTLQQAGAVKDALGEVLDRGTREGRARLDDYRADRRSTKRRADAIAELGEIVLDLIRRGEIDLGELPEARDVIDQLEAMDAASASASASGGSSQFGDDDGGASYLDRGLRTRVDDDFDPGGRRSPREAAYPAYPAYPASRSRFDDRRDEPRRPAAATVPARPRAHSHSHDDDREYGHAHGDEHDHDRDHAHRHAHDDDDRHPDDSRSGPRADDSRAGSRPDAAPRGDAPRRGRDSRPTVAARSSRDARDDSSRTRTTAFDRNRDADRDGTVSSTGRRATPSAGASGSGSGSGSQSAPGARVWRPPADPAPPPAPAAARPGIRFDAEDDADLADFMHPDDVPPKPDPDRS